VRFFPIDTCVATLPARAKLGTLQLLLLDNIVLLLMRISWLAYLYNLRW